MIHGGDIYRNKVELDFSVNVNPLGIPERVKGALQFAVSECMKYPDPRMERLRKEMSRMLSVREEYLLFGNGASELFMAVIHALKPKRLVIPVPSFYGYEYVADAGEGDVIYYQMKQETGFVLDEEILHLLDERVDVLFLANPNNPTGNQVPVQQLKKILSHCREKNIYVVLDECFVEFSGEETSMLSQIESYDNLLLIRAFTKIFAIPGVRFGYLVSSNNDLLRRLQGQLPEWNLSIFSQLAGIACAGEKAFIRQTYEYVKQEREYLTEGIVKTGITVFPSHANFIMVYTELELYEDLLKRGILVRDCSNFRGLSKGYYRIAVRRREDNELLLKRIGELLCMR